MNTTSWGLRVAAMCTALSTWSPAMGADAGPAAPSSAAAAAAERIGTLEAQIIELGNDVKAAEKRSNEAVARLVTATASADRKVILADAKTAVAEAATALETERKEAAQFTAADVKSGKVIESGVTAGAALTLNLYVGESNDFDVSHTASTQWMPYVALFPAYWRARPEQNKYCASSWSTTAVEAQTAADYSARKRAALILDKVASATASTRAELIKEHLDPDGEASTKQIGELSTLVAEYQSGKDGDPDSVKRARADAAREAFIARVSTLSLHWSIAEPAACGWYKVGAYVSYSPEHDEALEVKGKAAGTHKVNGGWGGGFVFAPNAYVALLVGATISYADVVRTVDGEDETTSVRVPALTFSLGGNLDLATLLK